MKRVYNTIIQMWIIFISIATFLGINSILKFDYSGFISGICTISSIMLIEYLYTKKEKQTIKEILDNIKIIQSLNYHNLKNIKNIEFSTNANYFAILNKEGIELQVKIDEYDIPRNQEMLINLDEKYNKMEVSTRK